MDSSSSYSVTKLRKHIDALSEFNFDSSQNVSDLLGSLSCFSNQSSPNFSSPTASTFDEGDEHLLDFLDSSKMAISTGDNSLDQSDLSVNIDFTPPKISKRRTSKKDKLKFNKNKEDEIIDFIDSFNNKFNLKATSLDDVIGFIETMKLENNEIQESNMKTKHQECKLQPCFNYDDSIIVSNTNSDQQMRIAQLQIERDNLQSQISDSQILIRELQSQISKYKSSNSAILESNKSLQRDITNLQNSMNSLHDIVEQQLSDISALSNQRVKLIEVTKRQESIIQAYDSLYNSDQQSLFSRQQQYQQQKTKLDNENQMKINLNKQQAKMEADRNNEFYTIMCSIVYSADNFLNNTDNPNQQNEETVLLNQIHNIRDNSEKTPKERILLITKSLISSISSYKEKNDKNEELIKKQTDSIEKYKRKCRDILSMYEEELNFLQTITHSNDLQAAIFSHKNYQTPLLLNDECKSELIRQCAILGRFIEETIGSISSDSFYNSFEGSDIYDSTNIFQLLQKSSIEKKMSNILNKIDDPDNIDTRQIFDLLAAQIFMNETLKNYTSELQVRLTQSNHELNFLRKENESLNQQKNRHDKQHLDISNDDPTSKQQNRTLQKLIKTFQKRENKLKRFTSNFVEIDDESNIIDATISLITQMNEQLLQQQSLSSQIVPQSPSLEESRLKEELHQCQTELKELENQLQKEQLEKEEKRNDRSQIDEQNKELKQQINSLNDKLNQVSNQSQSYQNEIQNLKTVIIEKSKQIEEINKEISRKQAQYDTSLDDAKNKLDSSIKTIQSLTNEIKQYEVVLARAKRQRPKLIKEIERLNQINQKLSDTISKQNNQIKNEYEIKISKLTQDKDVAESKNQQLVAEIATLTIEKKSTDLKLQSFDKRLELEKQNLITQFNAKSNSIQVEQEQQINNFKTLIEETIHRLSQLLTEEFSTSDQISLFDKMKTVVSLVESDMKKMKNIQCLYVDLLDDVNQAHKLLKVGNSTKISEVVNQLLSIQELNINSNSDLQKIIRQNKTEIEKLKKTINKFENKSASLKHWENWAKRLYRVIHESGTRQLNNDELRLSLEEALLASVSHRSALMRIESLRSQKIALIKFDSRLLLKPILNPSLINNNSNRLSLHSIIAVLLFVRRAQIQARCLPLNVRNNDLRPLNALQIQRPENINTNSFENDEFKVDNQNDKKMLKPINSLNSTEKKFNLKRPK